MRIHKVRYEFCDDYEWIRVIDVFPQNHRYLHFEDSIQGAISLDDPARPVLEYVRVMAEAARTLRPAPRRVLIGGLGSGALQHQFSWWWGGKATLTSVESNPRVYEIAKRHFRIGEDVPVIVGDLRQVMEDLPPDSLDLVCMDCYTATSIAHHLTTREFLSLMFGRLNSEGCAVFNFWSPASNQLCGDQIRTILAVFGEAGIAACGEDRNLIVLARKGATHPWPSALRVEGVPYPLRIVSRRSRSNWPSYMRGGGLIRDDNFGSMIGAIRVDLES